jgi:hypothetical protein
MNSINFFIVKFLAKVKFANIINIAANKEIIPELLQSKCNSKNIFSTVDTLLSDKNALKHKVMCVYVYICMCICIGVYVLHIKIVTCGSVTQSKKPSARIATWLKRASTPRAMFMVERTYTHIHTYTHTHLHSNTYTHKHTYTPIHIHR